jgi:hypothetical protein
LPWSRRIPSACTSLYVFFAFRIAIDSGKNPWVSRR